MVCVTRDLDLGESKIKACDLLDVIFFYEVFRDEVSGTV